MKHYISTLPSGIDLLHVERHNASAIISLYGAHLLSWKPVDQSDIIWLSPNAIFEPGQAIRGGIPICWPWFGPKVDASAHGYARTSVWTLASIEHLPDRTIVTLTYADSLTSSDISVSFSIGADLTVSLTTNNNGVSSLYLTEALHTYFSISDINKIHISGIDSSEAFDKTQSKNIPIKPSRLAFTNETDLVIPSSSAYTIYDPGFGRDIIVSKTGSHHTVVWNPWIDKAASMKDMQSHSFINMVCVEAANCTDIIVKPQQSHTISQHISVSSHAKSK